MSRKRHRTSRVRRAAPGTSPGTISIDPKAKPSQVTVMAFDKKDLMERDITDISELGPILSQYPMAWVNVDGLGNEGALRDLAKMFDLHPLAMEDVVNLGQRPKNEDYETCHFMILRMPLAHRSRETEQLSLFFGSKYVLTFQEVPEDCLEPVRKRIREGRSRIRTSGSGYLAYAIMDAVVDSYYPLLESREDRLLEIEAALLTEGGYYPVERLYDQKRDITALVRTLRPLRDAIGSLLRLESSFISDQTRMFLRDCFDHANQVVDLAELDQETVSSLIELNRSNGQNRLNEVMKVLTVTATIFIPLSFIAGVYGMNFDPEGSPLNMPELAWYWGYPFALTLMGLAASGMLLYFKRKGWIGTTQTKKETLP